MEKASTEYDFLKFFLGDAKKEPQITKIRACAWCREEFLEKKAKYHINIAHSDVLFCKKECKINWCYRQHELYKFIDSGPDFVLNFLRSIKKPDEIRKIFCIFALITYFSSKQALGDNDFETEMVDNIKAMLGKRESKKIISRLNRLLEIDFDKGTFIQKDLLPNNDNELISAIRILEEINSICDSKTVELSKIKAKISAIDRLGLKIF